MKVGIVGAGIMGRLLAYTFANMQYEVSLFDKDSMDATMNCSMAAAGLLTPMTELDKSPLMIYQLGEHALREHWPALIKQLGNTFDFCKKGTLALCHPKDQIELQRFVDLIRHRGPHVSMQKVTDVKQLEPELAKFSESYFFADEAQVDTQLFLRQLSIFLQQKNVKFYDKTLVKSVCSGKIELENKSIEFDIVFDCRGMGSKELFNDLYAIRGELIWLQTEEVKITRPIRFLHPRASIYLVPRANNTYLLGASEIISEDYSAISVRSTLELLTLAYYLHPAFAEARIIKTVTHCRPALTNYLPKIKYKKGLVAINGLYRHGFLIAPVLADEIKKWLQQGKEALTYSQLWEEFHD